MGDLFSRFVACGLRLYAIFDDSNPLLNVAPYGNCNTDSDALEWLKDETNAQVGRNCLEWGGIQRCWYTYIPAAVSKNSINNTNTVPLVIHLHGAGGCATLPSMGWGTLAEEDGFVVVWPQGTKHTLPFLPDSLTCILPNFVLDLAGLNLNCWNDGSGLFGAEEAGIDDMGFLQAMIEDITARLPSSSRDESRGEPDFTIDTNRIYLSGHSNGATMAQRFALQTTGIVTGVLAFSGAGMPNDPEWSPGGQAGDNYNATPIILVAGTEDGVVPFFERAGPLAGAIPSLRGWASVNGCTADNPVEQGFSGYSRFSYEECSGSSQVVLLKVFDEGHHPFTKGDEPFQISPTDLIANCPFRGPPMFSEIDCKLATELDTPRIAWDFMKQFQPSFIL